MSVRLLFSGGPFMGFYVTLPLCFIFPLPFFLSLLFPLASFFLAHPFCFFVFCVDAGCVGSDFVPQAEPRHCRVFCFVFAFFS